jgi:1,2-diacylglycerol 3-beta-glucosyltransferase
MVVTYIAVLFFLSYTLAMFITSRRPSRPALLPPDDLFFVFVVPCLNEELVVGKCIERLLDLGGERFAVLVIDDGSDDRTAEMVASYSSDRVWLLRRVLPLARQGKGEALNAALRYLTASGLVADRRPEDVVVAVVDADGRLAPNALFEVAPYFRDPNAGAVQIGVRMYNKADSLLARMQDFEFVTFTEIFQRARQRVGSVGLGGNGQIVRLTALRSLGDEPWSDCLTEDLDLGIRLLAAGWANSFCPTTYVSQQAVGSFRKLVRQRSRWFQGHLQCWKRLPLVFRAGLPLRPTLDLAYHLTSPALVLASTLPVLTLVVTVSVVLVTQPQAFASVADGGWLLAIWYLLAFGLAPMHGFVYWQRDRETGILRSLVFAHCYSLYSYIWLPAGWWAVIRVLRHKRGWVKTSRSVDGDAIPVPGSG